jgi:DNA polymerase (family 10)
MKNQELSKILNEIADFLEADHAAFKPFAYRKAAATLETMEESAAEVYAGGGIAALKSIPGVGSSIAGKIEEYLKTGTIGYYEKLKKNLPVSLEEIIAIQGMGPKRAKILYKKLGVKTVAEVEAAAKARRIAPLFGFGEKTEANILEGIEFLKRSKGRLLLGEILPRVREVRKLLEKLPEIKKVEIAGSLRRMRETIGDADFLVILAPKAQKDGARRIMDYFTTLDGVVKVWGKGGTKASVHMKEGFDMDIRVLSPKSYGAALQYFTGSKDHNVALRRIAQDKGLKLSEYGLFRGPDLVGGQDEAGIYKLLGLQFVPPEMRENQGEVKAAKEGRLPKIIGYNDILGDLHCHSDWDGGSNSIEELADAAMARGYKYIGIADHTKFLKIERGLDEKTLAKRNRHIDRLNEKLKNEGREFRILKGCEANIMPDGSIDITDQALKELDFAIAGVHSSMKMDKASMTKRMIKAMENQNIDIISHPTGRLLKQRDEYPVDFDKLLETARITGTILEINSCPARLDLSDLNVRRAKSAGVKMVINTDAHFIDQLRFIEYGIAQARRGWAEKKDIANTRPLRSLPECFKK